MYIDNQLILEEGWDIGAAGAATTDYSDQSIDLAMAARDIGKGRQLYVVIVVTEAVTPSSTAGTVTFNLLEEADATIDSGSTILLSTEAFVDSALTLGRAPVVIPVPSSVALQHLGMSITWTQTLTTGILDVFLTTDVQTN